MSRKLLRTASDMVHFVQYASRNLVGFRAHHVEIHSKVVGQKRMLNKLQQTVFWGPAYLNYR